MKKDKGRTENEMHDFFGKNAGYLGGGCYGISHFGRVFYNKCTNRLFKEWIACYVERDGRYFYS